MSFEQFLELKLDLAASILNNIILSGDVDPSSKEWAKIAVAQAENLIDLVYANAANKSLNVVEEKERE